MASEIAQNRNPQRTQNDGFFATDYENLTSSTYTLAHSPSDLSYVMENWMQGVPAIAAFNQNDQNETVDGRPNPQSRPGNNNNVPPPHDISSSGIWYVLAMILPLISINNGTRVWGCSASTILHAAEFLSVQINNLFESLNRHLRVLAQDQIARDLFATIMDVVLIIYAMGFLVLSLYQASGI